MLVFSQICPCYPMNIHKPILEPQCLILIYQCTFKVDTNSYYDISQFEKFPVMKNSMMLYYKTPLFGLHCPISLIRGSHFFFSFGKQQINIKQLTHHYAVKSENQINRTFLTYCVKHVLHICSQ